jgi:hypothetical protein
MVEGLFGFRIEVAAFFVAVQVSDTTMLTEGLKLVNKKF